MKIREPQGNDRTTSKPRSKIPRHRKGDEMIPCFMWITGQEKIVTCGLWTCHSSWLSNYHFSNTYLLVNCTMYISHTYISYLRSVPLETQCKEDHSSISNSAAMFKRWFIIFVTGIIMLQSLTRHWTFIKHLAQILFPQRRTIYVTFFVTTLTTDTHVIFFIKFFQRSLLEPMVKYVGNMHGNEAVSRLELMVLSGVVWTEVKVAKTLWCHTYHPV